MSKTARELRSLILGEVQDQMPCPHGIDVSIAPGTAEGSWLAYVMPPEHSQWSDCAKLIGGVAMRLQREYVLEADSALGPEAAKS